MTPLPTHPETATRGLRRAFLQAASDLLTARARRRSADRVRARPRLEGLEDRCLLSPTITEFPAPANAGPWGITAGPDGNLWFTEAGAGKIGMINPNDPTHPTDYSIPTANEHPTGITAGPDGNLWFGEYQSGPTATKIGMINPNDPTHTISEFPVPTANGGLEGIAAGPDGNLWFVEYAASKIGMINPTTHTITEFATPTANASPAGITAGPDGNVWFTEPNESNIGMIDLAHNYKIHEFAVSLDTGGVTAGPDGNLWFTEGMNNGAGKIGEINPTTHAINEFAVPTPVPGFTYWITAGPDGNLWFPETVGKIGTITTAGVITEYPIPYANAYPFGISVGPDGNVWFADRGTNNAIGVVSLYQTSSTHLVVTQQPPSSVNAGNPFGLTVTAEDGSGNPITSFNDTVTVGLANNPGGTTLGGPTTATASNGVAVFSGLMLNKAAIGYMLDAYASNASGLGGTVTSAMTVTPLAASQLVITQQPSATATAGQPFATQPVISEEDAFGNVETGDNSTVVTAALASGTGPLLGTTTVTLTGGVAAFTNLADNEAETLTLQFSGGGFPPVTSSSIVVSPAAAVKLAITTQPPSSVAVNAGFSFIAAVEDAYGNVVPSASNSVTVALANNPTRARLSGTTKVTASQGLATFTGLSLNKVGSGYTLQVTTKGLTSATTNPFNVTQTGTAPVRLLAPAENPSPDLSLAPLVFDSPDLWDGLGFKKRSRSS
jgi:streptogramin lyase